MLLNKHGRCVNHGRIKRDPWQDKSCIQNIKGACLNSTASDNTQYKAMNTGICTKMGKQPPSGFTFSLRYKSIIAVLNACLSSPWRSLSSGQFGLELAHIGHRTITGLRQLVKQRLNHDGSENDRPPQFWNTLWNCSINQKTGLAKMVSLPKSSVSSKSKGGAPSTEGFIFSRTLCTWGRHIGGTEHRDWPCSLPLSVPSRQ